MLKVITVTNNITATEQLKKSLEKHNWDYHIIDTPFRGFGTKLIETHRYLKHHTEVKEFIFCDAFDVIALGTPAEFLYNLPKGEIVCSAEKGIWPQSDLEKYYPLPRQEHGFNYLNSGLYYAKSKAFIELFESSIPEYATDDQLWFTNEFLFNELSGIVLETGQRVFNSHSFISDGEYEYANGRIKINGNYPIFIHFNGSGPNKPIEILKKLDI